MRRCKPRRKLSKTTWGLRSPAQSHWFRAARGSGGAVLTRGRACLCARHLRSDSKSGCGGGTPSLGPLTCQGEEGVCPPKSRPFPPLPWATRTSWVGPGPTCTSGRLEAPTPHGRCRPPHLQAPLGWKLLQPPQGRPFFRLHPSSQPVQGHVTRPGRASGETARPRDSRVWPGRRRTPEPVCACVETLPAPSHLYGKSFSAGCHTA